MTVAIVPAGPTDLERLLPHTERFWAFEKLPFELERVRRALADLLGQPGAGRVWLAERDGEVVGYLVLAFGYSIEHGGRDALIDELYMPESERGRGVGTALLTEAFATCEREGIGRIHLEVDNTNPRAAALYARLGFTGNDRRLLTRAG